MRQAWTTAFLPTSDDPRLDRLLFRSGAPAPARSWEDEFATFSAWATAH